MKNSDMARTMGGFTAGGAFFGAVDGFLVGGLVGGLAGALIGALVGAGVVLLAFAPRPQDTATEPSQAPHANYMLVWGALFLMTMLEVGVAFLAFAKVAIIAALIILAVWKALLVAMYYMHLRYEPRRLWFLVASPLPLAIILVTTVLFERW